MTTEPTCAPTATAAPRAGRSAAARARGWALALATTLAACASTRATAPVTATGTPGTDDAATPTAAIAANPTAPLGPATLALLEAALALQRDDEVARWSQGNEPLAAAPASVQTALAALRRWTAAGEAIPLTTVGERFTELASLPTFARVLGQGAVDVGPVTDLLRVAQALRAPDNAAMSQLTGMLVAVALYEALARADAEAGRTAPLAASLRALAPTDAEALTCARNLVLEAVALARQITWESLEREAAGRASRNEADHERDHEPEDTVARVERYRRDARLPLGPGWLRADFDAHTAFWDETERLARAAPAIEAVARVAAERLAAGHAHPSSMLVRLVAPMVLSDHLVRVTADVDAMRAQLARDLQR